MPLPDERKSAAAANGRRLALLGQWLFAAIAIAVFYVFAMLPVERPTLPPRSGPAIADARSWGYQLQNVNLVAISTGTDVLVVDYSRDGSEQRVLAPIEIETLRQRADGSKRIVLAYMSIGEAEDYRYYWHRDWRPGAPAWLGPENGDWRGNYAVRFWNPDWRRIFVNPRITLLERVGEILLPARLPYIDRVIVAGFDGVYLDRVDAFETWSKERRTAAADMVKFVQDLSAYGKARRPGFLLVIQNGEELLRAAEVRLAVDAAAKEDLLYGIKGDGKPNDPDEVRRAVADLNRLKADGKPVFVVEYLTAAEARAEAQRELTSLGYTGTFAERSLRHVPE